MVWIGSHHYGVVDQVPGVLKVATRFFHFNFWPLIPYRTELLIETDPPAAPIPIRFSWKSALMGWLRSFMVGAAICFGSLACATWELGRHGPTMAFAATGLVCLAGWPVSRWLTRAGPDRARELARLAGLPQEAVHQTVEERFDSPVDDVFDPFRGFAEERARF